MVDLRSYFRISANANKSKLSNVSFKIIQYINSFFLSFILLLIHSFIQINYICLSSKTRTRFPTFPLWNTSRWRRTESIPFLTSPFPPTWSSFTSKGSTTTKALSSSRTMSSGTWTASKSWHWSHSGSETW